MRKGFIYDQNKCVSCNACKAACILENGWKVQPRNIFTYNSDADSLLTIVNLSLACNHCESAICMTGCPASAYSRDPETGAIILDEMRCIGCRYCLWNCPYDAPKFDSEKKIIKKCDLCNSRLKEGFKPACTSSCPTGALGYGLLTEPGFFYSWFPDKKLSPAIEFAACEKDSPLIIIPDRLSLPVNSKSFKVDKSISGELSLIAFTYLTTLSVSLLISSLVKGIFPDKLLLIPILILSGIISLFHLGKWFRAWRSVINMKSSPLSREIIIYIVFAAVSSCSGIFHLPGLLIASSIIGLILLLQIDHVYFYPDRSKTVFLHSGQTFLSALLIASFFSGILLALVFTAMVKLASSLYIIFEKKLNNNIALRFMRLSFLLISGISMFAHSSYPDLFIISLFLVGELFDRILFYIDFDPLNINTLISKTLNSEIDEKKRG